MIVAGEPETSLEWRGECAQRPLGATAMSFRDDTANSLTE